MLKTPLFGALLFLLAAVGFLHILASKLYLYWTIWWFDLLMHFLGGAWITLAFLWFLHYSGVFGPGGYKAGFLKIAALSAVGGLLVGIFWEIFELKVGLTLWPDDAVDTYTDLAADFSGALACLLVFRNHAARAEKNSEGANNGLSVAKE